MTQAKTQNIPSWFDLYCQATGTGTETGDGTGGVQHDHGDGYKTNMETNICLQIWMAHGILVFRIFWLVIGILQIVLPDRSVWS